MSRLFTSFLWLAAGLVALAGEVQADATIFLPAPTNLAALHTEVQVIGISPIGTSGGATEYILTELITAVAFDSTTITFAPTVTRIATIEEGASTYHASSGQTITLANGVALAVDQDVSCGQINGDDDWTCVEKLIDSMQGVPPQTVTITTVAKASPVFTITEANVVHRSTESTISGANRAVPFMASVFMCVTMGVISVVTYVV